MRSSTQCQLRISVPARCPAPSMPETVPDTNGRKYILTRHMRHSLEVFDLRRPWPWSWKLAQQFFLPCKRFTPILFFFLRFFGFRVRSP